MLSQVCSKVGRYSHTPVANPKIHQAQRLINSQSYQNYGLTQMNRDCLANLRKVELNTSLCSTMCKIEDTYREKISDEIQYEYNNVPADRLIAPDSSYEAEQRALGFQLACGLGTITHFLENYAVTAGDMTFEAAIVPKYKNKLVEIANNRFVELEPSDQMALASATQPEVLMKLGLPVSREAMNLSLAEKNAGRPQLREDHLLALFDYCNSQTGMFNPINDSMRLWQISGVGKLASITSCLSKSLNEALNILFKHDAFVYRGPLYKGIILYNPAGPFRVSKMQPGMEHTSPHWSSSTRFEQVNYARTKLGRMAQVTICDAEGVRAHIFNDAKPRLDRNSIVGEGEVMMPPKPLHFLNESEVEPDKLNPKRNIPTIYCTMKPNQPETDSKPKEPYAIRV
jgi:hypothetical protein